MTTQKYVPVKVRFPEGPTGRTYTFLAPESWRLQKDDQVRESSMTGSGYAIVVDTHASTVPSHTPLKVLDSFERPPKQKTFVVKAPRGTTVEVYREGEFRFDATGPPRSSDTWIGRVKV